MDGHKAVACQCHFVSAYTYTSCTLGFMWVKLGKSLCDLSCVGKISLCDLTYVNVILA